MGWRLLKKEITPDLYIKNKNEDTGYLNKQIIVIIIAMIIK